MTATKGIAEALKLGREAVAMLDAVIRQQFAKDATGLPARPPAPATA